MKTAIVALAVLSLAVAAQAQLQICLNTDRPAYVGDIRKLSSAYQGGGYSNLYISFDYPGFKLNPGEVPPCVSSYKIVATQASNGKTLVSRTLTAAFPGESPDIEYLITNLPANTDVKVTITAVNSKGSSGTPVTSGTFKTAANVAPPCSATAKPVYVKDIKFISSRYQGGSYSNLEVSWVYPGVTINPVPCVTSFKAVTADRKTGKTLHTDTFEAVQPGAGTTSGLIINLPAATEVFVTIYAIGSKGEQSTPINSPTFKTAAAPPPPSCDSGKTPSAPTKARFNSATPQTSDRKFWTVYLAWDYAGTTGLGCVKEWVVEVYNANTNKLAVYSPTTFPAADKNAGLSNAKVINVFGPGPVYFKVYGKGLNGAVGSKATSGKYNLPAAGVAVPL